jgi:hypothetical protein
MAFVSDDDAKTWRGGLLLDDRKSIAYPDGVQSQEGKIYLIYDRERTRDKEILLTTFIEADILAGKRVDLAASGQPIIVNKATGQQPPKAQQPHMAKPADGTAKPSGGAAKPDRAKAK